MTFTACLRPAALLAAALTLSACGGKATFPITGTVTGLQYPGLVLKTNGMELNIDKDAKTFSFPNTLSYGDVYALQATQPQHQTCNFVDPNTGRDTSTDTAGRLAGINIAVNCATNTYSIGGTVSGLTSDGLVLTNGTNGGSISIAKGATSFAFPSPVAYNVSYGVTVLTQPADNVCSVTRGTGIMGDAAVTIIAVDCVAKPVAAAAAGVAASDIIAVIN